MREVQHRAFSPLRVLAGVRGKRDDLRGKFRCEGCERGSGEAVVDVVLFSVKRLIKVKHLFCKT